MAARQDATRILTRAARGESSAARDLMPLVYDELRELARKYFRHEPPGHTLQPTALVNEAYLRLVNQDEVGWNGRTHFFAVAAREMRRVLVDHARRRRAAKRGGSWSRIHLEEAVVAETTELDVAELEEALEKLSMVDRRAAQVVECRFFGGLTIDEVAKFLGVSSRTVRDDWHMARAWLANQLKRQA